MVSKQFLLLWCQTACNPKGITIKNFSSSFSGGVGMFSTITLTLALCAILHYYKPDLFHWSNVDPNDPEKTIKLAYGSATKAGIEIFLDVEDLVEDKPEALSVFTQVLEFYINLRNIVKPATIGKRGPRVNFMQTMSRPVANQKKVLTLNTQLKKNRKSIQLSKLQNPMAGESRFSHPDDSTTFSSDGSSKTTPPAGTSPLSITPSEPETPETLEDNTVESVESTDPVKTPPVIDAPLVVMPESTTSTTSSDTDQTKDINTDTTSESSEELAGIQPIDMDDTYSFQITGITTQTNKEQNSYTQITFTYVVTSGSEELTIGFARTWEEIVQLHDRMNQLFPDTSEFPFPKTKSSLFGMKKHKTFKMNQLKDLQRGLVSYFESIFSSALYRDSAYISNFINPSFTVDYDQLDSIVKEGSLSKRGHKSTGWRTRHFVLVTERLYYYKKKHDQTPRGSIMLIGCTYVDKDTPHPSATEENPIVKVTNSSEFALVTGSVPPVVYHIKASNSEERDEWKTAIQSILLS